MLLVKHSFLKGTRLKYTAKKNLVDVFAPKPSVENVTYGAIAIKNFICKEPILLVMRVRFLLPGRPVGVGWDIRS